MERRVLIVESQNDFALSMASVLKGAGYQTATASSAADAQRELQTMRDELLQPIAGRATNLLQALADEKGYTLVIDVSNPESNVIWKNDKYDITSELLKRIDATTPPETGKTEPPKTGTSATPTTAPTTPRPSTPAPTTTRPPATTTPRPTTPGPKQ